MSKLKQTISILILLFSIVLSANTTTPNAVVKVFASISLPDYQYPWQTSRISKFTGSGAVINGNRILTSAHVVSGARFIEVKKENDPKKYIATVKYISHQPDLAILELEDKNFFTGIESLKLNDNIEARDKVTVLGYPLGGNNISTTTGIVSRIEYRSYVWSKEYLLAIQIDAAINSGNSGGPVVNDKNELLGIAMMRLTKSSNIGYIVPATVINTFLKDIKDGVVDGFHKDTVLIQHINNDALKEFYALGDRTGILVTDVGKDEKAIRVEDIILAIDNKSIANNGTVKTKYGHINFNIAFHEKQIGQSVKLNILRDKKEMTIEYTVKKVTPLIYREFGKEPRYILYGGFAFTPLTKNKLSKNNKSSTALKMVLYEKSKIEDYHEAVSSMSTIFPNKVNRGYYAGSYILDKVNGIKVKSFKHLVEMLDNIDDEFTVFDFLEKNKIILNTKEAKDSRDSVMKIYNLKSDRRE